MSVSTVSPVQTIVDAALAGDATPYAAADVKVKAAVRKALDTAMRAAIAAGDITQGQAVMAAQDLVVGSKIVTATEVDHTQVLADKIMTLSLAASMLETGEALDAETNSKIDFDRLADLLMGTYSDGVREAATKIAANVKIVRTQAEGRSLQEAFDSIDVPSGTWLTTAQIQKATGLPSGGAISSRLFPKDRACTLTGWTPERGADGTMGARKN